MKLYLTLVTILLATFGLFAQPVNDDCAGIIDLGEAPYCSNPAAYTNVGATASDIDPTFNIPACFNSGGVDRDVWFQFTVPANGSIVDFTVNIYGNDGTNGTLENPQVAVYRGDCSYGNLNELGCASAPNGTNTVALDLIGLTPGLTYFIRVNDYSASATPNSGTFKLCVSEYIAEFIMGETASSSACSGTLYDSGGAGGDYGTDENNSFTICPQDFHSCIILNVEYDVEEEFDFLSFYQGADISGVQLTEVTGVGNNFEVQVSGACATVYFTSDNAVEQSGFKITWTCSPTPCTTPPLVTCTDPVSIPGLPFSQENLSNCFSGNSIASDPCGSGFITGNDYVFTYESPGDECVKVSALGTNGNAGLGVYNACPTTAGADCIAVAGGNFGTANPVIQAAFLENPGTYYFVFATDGSCSPFNFSVDTVTCPVLLPPASTCDQALNIGGCSNELPEIIALNPGSGDPNFIVDGLNQGCFVLPQQNYSFFYFVAGADGKFGFTVQAADPAEASDIDVNVWGPIPSIADICDYTTNNQPIRSTWSGGADPTGLEDIHPVLGTPVTDEFDCGDVSTPSANGDDFVRRLDVQQGEIYVILLDDYGQAIENGGIAIDFSGTTDFVLTPPGASITAGPDTAVCVGQSAQLVATGGEAYSWTPNSSLSCSFCPNPVASPTESTSYTVQIATTCGIIPKTVDVEILEVNLGPDVVVCSGAEFQLNPNPFPNVTYNWIGFGLNCLECPTPTVSGLAPGIYTYFCFLTSTFCSSIDTLVVTVLPGQQPQYTIAPDQTICAGTPVQLGGVGQPGVDLTWTSSPAGFTSTASNPVVTPTVTTKYYLSASNPSSCPVPALDSVLITVNPVAQLNVANDTVICQGQSVKLANTNSNPAVTYAWSPSFGTMTQPNVANPVETPQATTTYTLNATLDQCTVTEQVVVQVIPLFLQLNVPDTLRVCIGSSVNIQANVSPAGTPVTWTPVSNLQIAPNTLSAVATPNETTLYTVKASVPGCTRISEVYIEVDSLPANLNIYPSDTTVCVGAKVLLVSQVYEPAEYAYMDFTWTPGLGQLTPDSLFNMYTQPTQTTVYKRVTQNGACLDTAFAVVNVIVPPMLKVVPSDTSVCPGQAVQLLVIVPPGVEDIKWKPADGLSCDDCISPIANVMNTTSYTVSGDFMGCPTSTSATINITNAPPIKFPTDVDLCLGESVTLNEINTPGATYTWTSTDPAFNQNNAAQPVITPTQTATYTVIASNGCPSSGSVTINVSDASLSISNDTSVCRFEPVLLTASGTLPGTYQWSNGSANQAITVPVDATTTYTVVYTYGPGCTKTADVTATVNGESVQLDLPNPVQLCPGQSITLNEASVPAGATYAWSANPPDPTLGATSGNPTVSPAASTTYTVVATLGQCTATRTVTIGVAQANFALPADVTICLGDDITLTAVSSGGDITWSTGATTASIDVSPVATTTYNAKLVYGNGCQLSDDVTVTVTPSFTLAIIAAPNSPSIGLGAPLELTANVSPSTNVNQFSFQWLQNGVTNIGTTPTITQVISTQDDSIRFVVVATSPQGCEKRATIGFKVVQPVVEIPNAFTPNGDDNNDKFQLVVTEGTITVESFEVFNRWGQRVYSGSGDTAGWDGLVGGKQAPVDVYIYKISWRKGDGSLQEPRVGEVTLLR